jgi:hypothetical protein
MTDRRRQLDELLRAKEGDAGCNGGQKVLGAYVDLELAGKDPAAEFPSTAIHLQSCPGCTADHHGLLEAARRLGGLLVSPEGLAAAAAGAGEPAPLLGLKKSRRRR